MNEVRDKERMEFTGEYEELQELAGDAEFKQVGRERKIRKKKNYPLRLLIGAGVIVLLLLAVSSSVFSIKTIEVEGNHYYSDDQVINMATAKTGVNIFWHAGKDNIKDNLLENPYFEAVKVSRKLPGTLVIEVEERQQMAAFTYGDKYVIVDAEGTVLRKSSVDPKLTILKGLTISKMNIGEKIGAEEEATLAQALKMLDAMKDGDIFFKKIDVSKVVIKAYIYDTLVVKGTPKQMMKAMERGDLQKVVNNLFKNKTKRGTINLGNHNYMSFSPDFS